MRKAFSYVIDCVRGLKEASGNVRAAALCLLSNYSSLLAEGSPIELAEKSMSEVTENLISQTISLDPNTFKLIVTLGNLKFACKELPQEYFSKQLNHLKNLPEDGSSEGAKCKEYMDEIEKTNKFM